MAINTENMRESFEAFCQAYGYQGAIFKRNLWKVWCASRESLVIELPTVGPEPEAPEDAIDDSYMDGHYAAIRMRNACSKAILAAGLKMKS